MSRRIPDTLRNLVAERAVHCCEYCRYPALYSLFVFQVDHIISIKHGGKTVVENLAYACASCNINKGADLGTFLDDPKQLIPFYNPREDKWREHFKIENALIIPKTTIAAATEKILGFNTVERIMERQILINAGLYPT